MTGHELLAELQRHPEWLDRPVLLLTEEPPWYDDSDAPVLLAVDTDQFEEGGRDWLVLSALGRDRPEEPS